ncbi:MAG TPA: hypothetical protein VGJ44_20900, partial [Kribbellaceae bacterium]
MRRVVVGILALSGLAAASLPATATRQPAVAAQPGRSAESVSVQSTSAPRSARSMIDQYKPSTAKWSWSGTEGAGYLGIAPARRQRLLFGFNIGALSYATVESATFSVYQTA